MAGMIKNCLGVDIGSQNIRVAQMEWGRKGPRVVGLYEAALDVDEKHNEAQRLVHTARQLQDLLKKSKVRTKNAVFCVSGQSVFVRQFKLPRNTPENMRRMISFAAREQIPFPLEKTIMEYQVFDEGDSNDVNVLLVAIKREFIMNYMRLVRRSGLRPVGISVSTLALYNFQELNTSTRDLSADAQKQARRAGGGKGKKAQAAEEEGAAPKKKSALGSLSGLLGKKGKQGKKEPEPEVEAVEDDEPPLDEMGFEEIKAYVNIGASLMDLAIPKPGSARMLGFSRSVPLAGKEMDRVIRERLNLDSLAEARRIKENEAAIICTEFEMAEDNDRYNHEASEAVTKIADRMIAELRRSLDFYISQPDGVAADSLVLSGGLVKLPFMASYIEEKMGLPVELAEPQHEQLRMVDPAPEPFAPFANAIGLGLQGLRYAQNRIDFLPEDIKNVRGMQEHPFEVVSVLGMALAIVGLSFNLGDAKITQYNSEVQKYRERNAQEIAINKSISESRELHQKVVGAYQQLASAAGRRAFWLDFMDMFIRNRPPEILVDEVQLRTDGYVYVRGVSQRESGVSQFIDALEEAEEYVKGVELNSMQRRPSYNQGIQPDPRFPDNQVFSFSFTIRTYIVKDRIRSLSSQPLSREQLMQQQMQGQSGNRTNRRPGLGQFGPGQFGP